MTGFAPVNSAYLFASAALIEEVGRKNLPSPRRYHGFLTRARYALLVEMARNAGDLAFADVGKRTYRLNILRDFGLVKRCPKLGRWELTVTAWKVLNTVEGTWTLIQEGAITAKDILG